MKLSIYLIVWLATVFMLPVFCLGQVRSSKNIKIGMAVEFTNHAAAAYIARDKGWFKEAGLNISSYETYVTGMALAAAIARGDIQVAYICLVPAINAYANAGVRIKVVAGTHNYGYGLAVNPSRVKSPVDLEKPEVRVGCIQLGGAADAILHKTMEKYGLDKDKILSKVQRMNPTKQLMAIKAGRLDAAFLPEHWATMTGDYGFSMLLTAGDVWLGMEGSVLVVKEDLISNHPEIVRKLVKVTQKTTLWTHENPMEAADILARQLSLSSESLKHGDFSQSLQITPSILRESMSRLDYDTDITEKGVQEVIDYVYGLGNIRQGFAAKEILDLRFLIQ